MSSGMYRNILEQPAVLQRVVDGALGDGAPVLPAGGRLYLIATGASLNAALASVPAFAKFAGAVPAVLPASEAAGYTHLFDHSSTVILISQSGDSYETKALCTHLCDRGIPFLGITNEADSTLARASTPLLLDAGPEVSSATKTHTATLLLLYALAVRGNKAGEEALGRLPQLAAQTLDDCRLAADDLAAAYTDAGALYVLGDNINGPTARQGALLFKEKVRLHAEGMTASEFRHGAVEVVERDLPILYIAPAAAHREESQTHITYLAGLGCRVTVVSPRPFAGVAPHRHIAVPDCGEDTFSQLCATLPLQLLAESAARGKGVDADGFRYLSKVVAAY